MARRRKSDRGGGRRRKGFDIDSYADKLYEEIAPYLSLDLLGVDEKLGRLIVREVFHILITSTSYKPSPETLVKRIQRRRRLVNKVVARLLLENIEKPSVEQLEFIIYNGEELIVDQVDRLYKMALEAGREDLVSYLRYVWEKYGRPTPVRCPRCGFSAVMPDYSCMVCGHVVGEDYVRRELGFEEKFRLYVRNASVAELRDVMSIGFVLASDVDVVSPRVRVVDRGRVYYPIYLRGKELSLIVEEINSRPIQV